MKKLTAIILALLMIFALCACEGTSDGKPDDGGDANVKNPMVEVTPEELESTIGVALVPPEGANDTMFFVIGGTLGEVQFKYGETNEKYSYRVQKTNDFQDISGVNFTTPAIVDAALDSLLPANITLDESEGFGTVTWYADGYSYSIYMGEGATDAALISIYQIISLEQ